jgi:hypothetical protein
MSIVSSQLDNCSFILYSSYTVNYLRLHIVDDIGLGDGARLLGLLLGVCLQALLRLLLLRLVFLFVIAAKEVELVL